MALMKNGKFQAFLNLVVILTIFLHVGVPSQGHDEEHAVCCHAGQQVCSVLPANQTSTLHLNQGFLCQIEFFSYQTHFVISQDPPPKTEWL